MEKNGVFFDGVLIRVLGFAYTSAVREAALVPVSRDSKGRDRSSTSTISVCDRDETVRYLGFFHGLEKGLPDLLHGLIGRLNSC